MKEEDRIAEIIVGSSLKVHKELGPGLFESTYEICLAYELTKAGLKIETQKSLPVIYSDVKLNAGYRLDILVENKVIVELKAVEVFTPIHLAQMLTYLKLSKCKLGLLITFNVNYLKNGGVRRVANGL
jgi:GxxExxY protein